MAGQDGGQGRDIRSEKGLIAANRDTKLLTTDGADGRRFAFLGLIHFDPV